MRTLSRRDLLRSTAATLTGVAALQLRPARAAVRNPRFSDYPFALGVASGEPSSDGFVLWTRLAPKPIEGGGMPTEDVIVGWQVAADEGFESVVASGETTAKPDLAHSVHIEVSGLDPHRWYFYRFRSGSEVSPTGRVRTAPDADVLAPRLRFAFASCQHYETGYYTAYEHMAAEDLDLVVHLGDYIYEGPGREGRLRMHTGDEIQSLADYRNRHALYRTDKQLQEAHRLFPWLVTWDDHEVDNNYADRISEEPDIAIDDFLTRRAHAYRAYYEHMPLRLGAKPRGHRMDLYRSVPYGRLAEFEVLDTRQYRSDQPCGDRTQDPCEGVFDAAATLLGDSQESWLMDRLSNSQASWNILAQQIMMGRVDRDDSAEGRAWSMDQWSGYDAPRKRLLSRIAEQRVSNPVVLTGDIHSNWVNDLQVDFDREEDPIVATEFVGTSISSGGDGDQSLELAEAMYRDNPFLRFCNYERGYVSCTLTPESWRSDYQVVEYVTKPGAPLVTRASFLVESGRPGAKML